MERLTEKFVCNLPDEVLEKLGIADVPKEDYEIKEVFGATCKEVCEEHECSNCPINKVINKLADYEDAEEQGLLLRLPAPLDGVEQFGLDDETIWHRLPCMTGTKVYEIAGIKWKGYEWKYPCYDNAYVRESTFELNDYYSFGKTVFLTKEEAEQALKQMGE